MVTLADRARQSRLATISTIRSLFRWPTFRRQHVTQRHRCLKNRIYQHAISIATGSTLVSRGSDLRFGPLYLRLGWTSMSFDRERPTLRFACQPTFELQRPPPSTSGTNFLPDHREQHLCLRCGNEAGCSRVVHTKAQRVRHCQNR